MPVISLCISKNDNHFNVQNKKATCSRKHKVPSPPNWLKDMSTTILWIRHFTSLTWQRKMSVKQTSKEIIAERVNFICSCKQEMLTRTEPMLQTKHNKIHIQQIKAAACLYIPPFDSSIIQTSRYKSCYLFKHKALSNLLHGLQKFKHCMQTSFFHGNPLLF